MKIGIIDIETTNFLRDGGFIVEVGIAALDLESGEVAPIFNSVCREKGMTAKDRNAWIFSNSDLTVEDVRNAPDLTEIQPDIQTCIDTMDACTAYNKAFDFGFLRSRGFTIHNEAPCPMLVAKNVCKLPGRYGDYKWPKVEEAWKHLFPDEPYVELHRGLDDAIHEARIVHALWKMGVFKCGEK